VGEKQSGRRERRPLYAGRHLVTTPARRLTSRDVKEKEVRVTDPTTGGQKGQKLCQLGAIDPFALVELGRVAGFGASKYARFNFAKGYAWSLSLDALFRHLLAWAGGQDRDPESGLHHMAHAAWHCCALLTFILRGRGTDDRLHRAIEASGRISRKNLPNRSSRSPRSK
jgi:hypothetical protein